MATEPATDPAPNLVETFLRKQNELTAVQKFAQLHEQDELPLHGKVYQDLIPATSPGENQQYAFEVDLDACSGCKACVAACHNLNGLEDEETWRSVGLLVGGSTELPVIQHVTTACHHCLDPACLEGCPVNAYDKDEDNGIVVHLDDQCIGCQYCIFKCPYDVPQYSHDKGIVRKCDMCKDRLSAGEAPACVQSCPNHAIRIVTVDQQSVVNESESNQFLPTAPSPDYTLPTTIFKTQKALPRNLLAADYFSDKPQHAHWPLVVMLVLTQLSVGAFVLQQFFGKVLGLLGATAETTSLYESLVNDLGHWPLFGALGLGLIGLGASVLHLGRPKFAFRAVLGLRTSWLSREIVAFGAFAFLASTYTFFGVMLDADSPAVQACGIAATMSGIFAVICSIMVYVDTPRDLWSPFFTSSRFILSCLVLGLPTVLLLLAVLAITSGRADLGDVMMQYSRPVAHGITVCVAIKLLLEAQIFLHARSRRFTPQRRTAQLMLSSLSVFTMFRFAAGIIGGFVLPTIIASQASITSGHGFEPLFFVVMVIIMWGALLVGEIMERYLFFTAVTVPRMPGITA